MSANKKKRILCEEEYKKKQEGFWAKRVVYTREEYFQKHSERARRRISSKNAAKGLQNHDVASTTSHH